jgi:hypothetical protein
MHASPDSQIAITISYRGGDCGFSDTTHCFPYTSQCDDSLSARHDVVIQYERKRYLCRSSLGSIQAENSCEWGFVRYVQYRRDMCNTPPIRLVLTRI